LASSAEECMKEGMENDFVLPKSLIKKIIPQFDTLTTVMISPEGITDVSEHLFYIPILGLTNT
jgi:hypothetical protein